jgi:hypothetical protein
LVETPNPGVIQGPCSPPAPPEPPGRFKRARRAAGAGLSFALMAVLCLLALAVVGLAFGRINLDAFRPFLVSSLQQRLGAGYTIEIDSFGIERQDHGLALALSGLNVRRDGRSLVSAPRADMIFDPLSLIAGNIKPSRVDIDGLDVSLRVLPDGSLDLSAGREPAPAPIPAAPEPAAADAPSVAVPTSAPAHPSRAKILRQAAAAINMIFDLGQGRDSPIALLDHLGIRGGRLIVDDREAGQKRGFEEFEFSLDRSNSGHRPVVDVKMAAKGPSGRWSLEGIARGGRDEAHELAIEGAGFSIDEIALLAGKASLPIDSDIPISFKASASFQRDGHVLDANARLALGQGFWRFDDPEFAPVLIDEFFGAAHWDSANHRMIIDEAQIFSGASRCFLQGVIAPPMRDAAPWSIVFKQGEPCAIGPDRAGEKSVAISSLRIELALDPPNKNLSINRFEMVGPEVAAAVQGSIDWVDGPHLRLGIAASQMTAAGVLAIWPNAFGAPVRGWVGDHLISGTLENFRMKIDLDDFDLRMMRAQHAPMDDRVEVDYKVRDVAFTFLDGAPAVTGVDALGHSTGRTARIDASIGFMEGKSGQRIDLSEGVMSMPDLETKPLDFSVGARSKGSLDALGEILAAPAFAKVASLPLDPKTTKGQFDGNFVFRTKLQKVYDPKLASIEVAAKVENFSAERLVGSASLEQASLSVSLLGGVTRVTGTGKIFGAPATLEFNRSDSEPPKGTISFPMDEAARAKAGLPFGSTVAGPIAVKIVGDVGAARPQAQVELDLTKAALNAQVPGVSKAAGRPAKVTFNYREDERGAATLDDFVFDGAGQSAKGVLQFGPDGRLVAAKLPQVKFSPGDNLQVDAQKAGDTMKIVARGAAVDARPFLDDLTGGDSARGAVSEFDLDLNATLLTGANRQIVSNAELRLAKKGGQYLALSFAGRLGKDPVKGVLTRPDAGAPLFSLTTSDGGALLAFLDLYSHMEGGALDAEFRLSENSVAGTVDVENFLLRGEPALKSFASQPGAEQFTSKARIDPSAVSFSRLHAMLQKTNGRLTVRDGAIANPSIGSTLEGWIDFDRDTLDVSGTFVPAYGVNNLFGQLPVIGLVLGGGEQEGLIGLNFRVSGKLNAPVLSVNPLSAIAPGFLRKIFGILPK